MHTQVTFGPFIQIAPFSENNPLDFNVQSDHAEIAVQTPDQRIINAWNISNPEYHCYFQYGENPPFKSSYLFVEHPKESDGGWNYLLEVKENTQVETLATRIKSGAVSIQVIVEGYHEFYDKLAMRLQNDFEIVTHSKEGNMTGIVIDTCRYEVISRRTDRIVYESDNDAAQKCEMYLPHARVKNLLTERQMIVMAVHVNGCGSQYPKNGLQALVTHIQSIWDEHQGQYDLLAIGDFNAPTYTAREELKNCRPQPVLLTADYLTHVNPKSQAANYDHAFMIKASDGDYQVMPLNTLTPSSQGLVHSINRGIFYDQHPLQPKPVIEDAEILSV